MKVTRVAYSKALNAGKWALLAEQAGRLGRVRSLVWQRYGSVSGAGVSDRQIRDRWMADGTAEQFGVLANAWKETVRDAVGDIAACRAAAKVPVRRAIARHTKGQTERRRLYTALKADWWVSDPFLSRLMRQHWRRGKNRTHNQIVIRADNVRTFTLADGGDVWLAVPGLLPRTSVTVPLNTTVAPTGTVRLILRDDRVEAHYQIDARSLPSAARPCGDREIGVDKGYTEVLVDSDGVHHGPELGRLLTTRSDRLKAKNACRAKLRSVAAKATVRGDHAKAARIARHNLGTVKRTRQARRWRQHVTTITYQAVNAVIDKAALIAAEDLTRSFTSRSRGKNMNRRLAAWTKGVTARALISVSERRGSVLVMVNAAYTSQVDPRTGALGVRRGEKLHCPGGVVWCADHAAAINALHRMADPDIGLHTPHTEVRRIVRERTDRHRISTADPGLQPSTTGGERNYPNHCSVTSND
jgi:Putative transposase DNA-binding domain